MWVVKLGGSLNADPGPAPERRRRTEGHRCHLRRLARMIGLDARDEPPARWLELAHTWRGAQVARIAADLRRVLAAHPLPPDAPVISAGCGDFLLPDLLAAAGESPRRPCWRHADTVARLDDAAPPGTATWAQVCAPAVAVAALWDGARR